MDLAQQIYETAKPLPEEYALEALRFIEFLRIKAEESHDRHVMDAQHSSMMRVWNNTDDEVWNDVAPR